MKKKKKRKLFFALLIIAVLAGAGLYFYSIQDKRPALKVYFFKEGKLFAVRRPIDPAAPPLTKAISELLAGPNKEELSAGISTHLPSGVKLLHAQMVDSVAVLDFSRRLEAYGGGSARIEGMIAQIVYTATEVPGVKKAWVWMEGEKELILGGEGLVLDRPIGRRDVSN